MTDSTANDDPLETEPTWNGDIKGFFDAGDIACMNAQGLDLSSYESVKDNAEAIYGEVKSGNMPAGGPPWSANRVSTFANWMSTGFPLGSGSGDTLAPPEPGPDEPVVEHPTWTDDISKFFRPQDIGCMRAQGIDLSTYEGVRSHATDIYLQTKIGNMPRGGPRWTKTGSRPSSTGSRTSSRWAAVLRRRARSRTPRRRPATGFARTSTA